MTARLLTALTWAGLLLAQRPPLETAWELVAQGKRQEAVRILDQIVKANPRDGDARLLLGSILAEEGKAAEAIRHIEEAVRLMPQSPIAHNALGEAFNITGDLKRARGAFEKAVALDPGFAQAHANLGHVLIQAGESEPAAEQLDRAIALVGQTPDAAYPLYLRAKLHTEQDELEKAAAALKQAVTLQPDFGEAWSDLGQARKSLLDDPGAFASFQRAVEVNPDNAVSQYRLGAEHLRRGNAHDAVIHLQKSFQLDPGNQSTLNSLQLALRQDGQIEEAKRIKEKLVEVLRGIDQQSEKAFSALRLNNEGAALERAGNLPSAAQKYRAAVALDPGHVGIRVNFGVVLLRLGRWKEGLAELREALRRDPSNTQVKRALDDALEQAPVEFGGKGKKKN
jgi:tetratricopeptide (TPR) repeat protein